MRAPGALDKRDAGADSTARLETRKLPPGFEVVLVSAVNYFFRQRGSVQDVYDSCRHWHSGFSG